MSGLFASEDGDSVDAEFELDSAAADRIWEKIGATVRALGPREPAAAEPDPRDSDLRAEELASMVQGLEFTPGSEGWQQTGIAGLRVKILRDDPVTDRRTTLVELAPGCSFPSHAHHGPEECYVISGDLATEVSSLYAGDYMRMPANSQHGRQTSEGGCVAVVIGSRSDVISVG